MRRQGGSLVAALLTIALAGCASALPQLDDGSDLGRSDPALADPAAARRHLREADSLFARRPDVAAVQASVEGYRRAAIAGPGSAEGILGAVRSLVWLATSGPEPLRAASAAEAVETALWCERREPNRVECDYRLALALGVQADVRRSTAFDGVRRMVNLLEAVVAVQPELDRAGPHRVLARVLVNAPGWPTGPGDPDRGLEHALDAVALDGGYPPNQLALGEALLAVDRTAEAISAYERALAGAREALAAGDPDAAGWVDEADRALEAQGRSNLTATATRTPPR